MVPPFSAIPLYRIAGECRVVSPFSMIPLYRMTNQCRVVLRFLAIPLYRIAGECRVVPPFSAIPLYRMTNRCRVVSPFSMIPLYKIRSRPPAGGLKTPPKAVPLSDAPPLVVRAALCLQIALPTAVPAALRFCQFWLKKASRIERQCLTLAGARYYP